jgi:methionyl-tRNA formyltransferase
LKTVYMGTSEFAAKVLRRLADSPHRPALVVAPPDRPRGRGRRTASPPVAHESAELGLDLIQTETVNSDDALARIRAADAELGVVCAFGQLIREPLLAELSMLNVHPSLLPRWRGAAPIERAIMAGDRLTGVTIIQVSAGYDSGPIALQEAVPIRGGEDFGSLADRLAELGGELIVRALDLAADDELDFVEQDESEVTYAEKLTPEERRLDPSRPATELERVVRALNPHLGCYLELEGGERLGVRAAGAESSQVEPGRLDAEDGTLRLGCGEGSLRLDLVQPAGGRPMAADAYLRGHSAPVLAG